jgi:hypothetical protein
MRIAFSIGRRRFSDEMALTKTSVLPGNFRRK